MITRKAVKECCGRATRKPIRSNLGSHALVYDDHDVAILLRAAIEDEGSQLTFARRHGVNRPCLNMALNGKRNLSRAVTEALGLRKVYIADMRSEPRKTSPECVYFIKCKQHIKIGLTSMPIEKRLGTLSSGSAGQMKVLATIKNASASVEHALHERFAKYRVRREWFKAAPEILAYIEEIKTKE
jgi:Meiotically up-regulated gene 113